MDRGNNNDSDLYNVNVLLKQLNHNISVYEHLRLSQFDKKLSELFSRLKMQKDLFIKEVERVFKVDGANDNHINPSIKFNDDGASGNEPQTSEQWIVALNELENLLIENYNTLLSDENLSEIAQMILRNHRNELKRDLKNLNELKIKQSR
jgi:hypothetical protein